ncbi:dTDP-4-dehydrorhamnose 3,5-epimerase family protein [Metabacillus halosaccharovorans]|uniref:dTDP-4-dehydrorhamnose 3,5-epimerase family protein n=1 Tax=Metabacillus halosaccharovorans TaxID=930124 RepID=UPI003735E923
MQIQMRETKIPGCYEIKVPVFTDKRGVLIKTFQHEAFMEQKLNHVLNESYYTISHTNVLRGLHFQLPPEDHVKIVHCLSGDILDVVVDLRVGSPTYGIYESFHLTPENANMVYIPAGLAHGYYVNKGPAIMQYQVSKSYSSTHDSGINWRSVGIPWPEKNPIISEKDKHLKHFDDFQSPFCF